MNQNCIAVKKQNKCQRTLILRNNNSNKGTFVLCLVFRNSVMYLMGYQHHLVALQLLWRTQDIAVTNATSFPGRR